MDDQTRKGEKKNGRKHTGVYPYPKSALQPRDTSNGLTKMERFVRRGQEENDNFLSKQTLKSKAAVSSKMNCKEKRGRVTDS